MNSNYVDLLIIGGGVIGLAIAKKFAAKGIDVIVIEKENTFGSVTSSRNSGVIHAGVYYDEDSLKAEFCAEGNRRMYQHCNKYNVPHINTGKFIVATSKNEIPKLEEIQSNAANNGVDGIIRVSGAYVADKEPLVSCIEALFVPSTGIVDQNLLMRSYLGELEENSGNIVFNSQFLKSDIVDGRFESVILSEKEEIVIESKFVINRQCLRARTSAELQMQGVR